MKKDTAVQRREPSLFDDEFAPPAPAAETPPEPVLEAEPTFTPEPLFAVDAAPDTGGEPPGVADDAPPRRTFKPYLYGGAGVVIAGLIGAIAWIGSTAGQAPKKTETPLAAPAGMTAKALPAPEISHPPAPPHVPSAIELPPQDNTAPPPLAPVAAAAVAPVAAAAARAEPPAAPVAPRAAVTEVRDDVRVARRAAPSTVKTAKAAKTAKTAKTAQAAASKRKAGTAAAKSTTVKSATSKGTKTKTVAAKAAAGKGARKPGAVRCEGARKTSAACRAKSQKPGKA